MSVPLTVNGVTFQYPQQFDRNWGPTLTNWSTAVTNVLAAFPSTGVLTLSPFPAATINFANATNTGFLALAINGYNQLTFNGTPIGATTSLTYGHILVGNVSNLPADVAMTGDITISNAGVTTLGALKVSNSQIATLAGIAFTKLASTSPYFWYAADSAGVLSPIGVTAARSVITDANGLPSASSVTSTELGYVSGVTSGIQAQIGSKLALSGGTVTGAINMTSNKITSISNGTSVGDAVAFGQLPRLSMPYGKRVIVSNITVAQNHVLWDDVVLEDTSGNKVRNNAPGSLYLIDISTNGVAGLDTGSVAANKFYFIWIISNGTQYSAMYSLSPSAPTMPSGYTYKLLAGCVLTDSSSHIIHTSQIGQHVRYSTPFVIATDTTNNNVSLVVLSVLAAIPQDYAWEVDLDIRTTAIYSSTPSGSTGAVFAGTNFGGFPVPPLINAINAPPNADGQFSVQGRVTLATFNETTSSILYAFSLETSHLTSYITTISVTGYRLSRLGLF